MKKTEDEIRKSISSHKKKKKQQHWREKPLENLNGVSLPAQEISGLAESEYSSKPETEALVTDPELSKLLLKHYCKRQHIQQFSLAVAFKSSEENPWQPRGIHWTRSISLAHWRREPPILYTNP